MKQQQDDLYVAPILKREEGHFHTFSKKLQHLKTVNSMKKI